MTSSPNRAALFTRIHKVLSKHYSTSPLVERPILEQLLFASCLENTPFAAAEAAYQSLANGFFDWNEVRVSTIKELCEAMEALTDGATAATSVRRILQHVFETTYSFDLESLRKLTLGQAQEKLAKIDGATPFSVACVTEWCLGGHSIPLDRGALDALLILGAITPKEREQQIAPGLERAIPKNKGVEFAQLLHHLSAELVANPYSTNLHKLLLEIAPDCKERLPKKGAKKPEPPAEPAKPAPAPAAAKKDPPVAEAKPAKNVKGAPPAPPATAKPAKKPAPLSAKDPSAAKDKEAPAKDKEAAKRKAAPAKALRKEAPAKKQPPAKKNKSAKPQRTSAEVAKRKPR